MGGLALAVGILVDNATVMIENIDTPSRHGQAAGGGDHRRRQSDRPPDVRRHVSITIVWLPLFDLSGVSGWLFMPMAEAVIFAMLASFVLSYTLVPTMAKYMLEAHQLAGACARRTAEAKPRGVFARFQAGVRARLRAVP